MTTSLDKNMIDSKKKKKKKNNCYENLSQLFHSDMIRIIHLYVLREHCPDRKLMKSSSVKCSALTVLGFGRSVRSEVQGNDVMAVFVKVSPPPERRSRLDKLDGEGRRAGSIAPNVHLLKADGEEKRTPLFPEH